MRKTSKYDERQNSTIRCNVVAALEELAVQRGIDIKTMKETQPYAIELGQFSSQKIASEIKKLVDCGMVVKSTPTKGTMKYMLRDKYEEMMSQNNVNSKYGYGDYRDSSNEPVSCVDRILTNAKTTVDMW